MVSYCGILRNLPGNGSWLIFTQETLLWDRMHSIMVVLVRFSDYEMGLLTKIAYGSTTKKQQVGFVHILVRAKFARKIMKCSMISPSCTILQTKNEGMSIDMLGRIWIKNVKKFPVTILQQAFFGVKLLASQICKAFAWKGQISLPSDSGFATGIQSSYCDYNRRCTNSVCLLDIQ